MVRRRQILPALTSRIHSVLRVLAPWAVVIVDASLASLVMWALIRQYGVSTAGSSLMPTPWETGVAPYVLVPLTSILASAILTAVGYRYGRYALMAVTIIYTLWILYWMVTFLLSMRDAQIQWTVGVVFSDILYFVVIIAWFFISYWSLFKASAPKNRLERFRGSNN
jgi:hypothetical protein